MTTYTDSHDIERSRDEIEEIEKGKCPICGSDDIESGVWIPTMTADLECADCTWSISYPYESD